MRVLLVDDSRAIRLLLRTYIGQAPGQEIVGEAENGAEGVEQARLLRPDVVIMDVQMPVMDGLQATQIITSEMPDVRVVLFTSSTRPSEAAVKRSGASAFFSKREPRRLVEYLASMLAA